MSDTLWCRWNGTQKISGIKAVRNTFNLGLKEAKAMIEDDRGFLMTQLQWMALRGDYMQAEIDREPGMQQRLFINDWMVESYRHRPPHDLTGADCRWDHAIIDRECDDN